MDNTVRGKVWGNTTKLFDKNNVEMHRIEVEAGGFCSKHNHQSKYNLFFVEEGELKIYIYREYAGKVLEDITTLKTGDTTYVEPGVPHMFRATEHTIAFEIYWVTLDVNDIVRETVGGIKD